MTNHTKASKPKLRRVSNPEYYVAPQSAARMLRQMADDLDKRPADEWISLKINSAFASQAEVEHSMKGSGDERKRDR